ncbi:TNT domain-containing protein [Nocardiopsis sp. FIRDI 009]|uniref:TNT domain-containing protein n=1 Tax=Nocardiopsis sp. FIRDI 009 TaxID=714197 RepID=UPI000E24E3C3|nr:TNT domain-containing protein [Nocardiopsis sp. FIRDI 009]
MARDYDSQLLESIAVRRQRLREAVLFGGQRTRRRLDENIGKVAISACLAAVVCGATVGWSFVTTTLSNQRIEQEQAASGPASNAIPQLPGDWVGTEVTLEMAREELTAAGVPESLYVIPGEERPEPGTVDSYYLLTEDDEGYLDSSVIDFDQGRPGTQFRTEDEAARWLFRELATTEPDPSPLTAAEEEAIAASAAELTAEVRENLEERSGDSYRHTLEVGDVVDAFGQESGRFLFPDGTPFPDRGLPEHARTGLDGTDLYHRYRVIHPFQVAATTAPANGASPGGGVRFSLDSGGFAEAPRIPTVRWLIGNGYLERVAVGDVPS